MVPKQNILIIGINAAQFETVAPLLKRKHFDVDRFPGAKAAMELVMLVPFAALILRYPLAEVDLDDFLLVSRNETSASKKARIALLASPEDFPQAKEYLKKKIQLVLPDNENTEIIEKKLSKFLGIRSRTSLRVLIKLDIGLEDNRRERFMAQSKNMSASGLFVISKRLYPVGSCAKFEFVLPNESKPFCGVAEVTRKTEPGDSLQGMGLKFLSFSQGTQDTLSKCLKDLGH